MGVTEGRIPFRGYETWYRSVDDADGEGAVPLLCLHGGPGANWLHMKPYEVFADVRRVVFYDQLGAGNSAVEGPHDVSLWTPELYVEEVDAVREALGLERVHVLGHSWGGMLAMQYAATRPDGLVSLIAQSSPPSVPGWMPEVARLRSELPAEVEATLREHEAAGTTDSPEYEEAMMVFYVRHLCRVDPWPDWLGECFRILEENPEVYHSMNGPSEFHVIGSIRDWQSKDRLGEIDVPTLLVSGRHDEATPATVRPYAERIGDARWEIFENSSHMPHVEEEERFLDVVGDFLSSTDRRS